MPADAFSDGGPGESATSCVIAFPEEVDILKPFSTRDTKKGVGSAFFVRCKTKNPNVWLALTCYHVVAGARDVRLIVPKLGSQQITANVLSVLPDHDIALLTVSLPDNAAENGVRSLAIGDSDALKTGALVTTYGFPLASKNMKVSEGVYAGISDEGLLQTTAAISPGNSGGAMVHNGMAIGVISQKVVSAAAANVGYAIPIALYRLFAAAMIQHSVVLKPMFGFCVQKLPSVLLNCKETSCGGGVLVVRVYDTCSLPGLKVGDIITSFEWDNTHFVIDTYGETRVSWAATKIDCMDALERAPLNQNINVHLAGGQKLSGTRNAEIRTGLLRKFVMPQQKWQYCCAMGMCFVPLCSNLLQTRNEKVAAAIFRIPDENRHKDMILTSWVLPNSTASEYNIDAGMIVLRVNDNTVKTMQELLHALARPRNGKTIIIEFTNSRVFAMHINSAISTELKLKENKVYTPNPEFLRSLHAAKSLPV